MPKESQSLAKIEARVEAVLQKETTETAYEVNGAIRALNSLVENLNSQVIHALQRFRDQKLYAAYDFTRFDDYLDNSPKSPMPYATFNRREKLLESEGDEAYDLLESLRVPVSTRKALPPESFEVRDNELIVTDEKGNEFAVPLSDTKRVKSIIANIARDHKDNKKKLSDEAKKTDALTARVKELSDAKSKPAQDATPYDQALWSALAALKYFTDKAALAPEEATAKRQNTLELIGQVWAEMNAAHKLPTREEIEAAAADSKPARKGKIPAEAIAAALGE